MAGKITRKELKTDKFAVEVEHTVDYFATHRTEVVRYGGALLALAVIIAGVFFYRSHQQTVREQKLSEAIQIQDAPVTPNPPPGGGPSFLTEEAKRAAAIKSFSQLATEYSGTTEGYIAEYYLAGIAADAGKMDEARKRYQLVADHGDKNFSSLAKLSLAQIDFAENLSADAEKLLRDLMNNPTDLVSKEQAAIALARGIGKTRPAEAKKLLEPLEAQPGSVGQAALTVAGDLQLK